MLLTASLIWGTAFVAQSEGMNYVEPFTYNAMRTLLGGFVLIPVILAFKAAERRKNTPKTQYSAKNTAVGGICCGVFLFIASSFQQAGIAGTTAGKAGFITALYILLVPIIGIFFRRKVPVRMWLFVVIAIIGFWLLCIKENFSISHGDVLVLICAVFFAGHIMVIDFFNSKNTDVMVMACIQFFTAGILMTAGMFLFEKPSAEGIISAKYTILYAGIMSSGVAYTLQMIGQRYTEPTAATLLMSLESVFAALSGWLILHEGFSVKEFTGCVLVFAAVILAQLFGGEKTDMIEEKGEKHMIGEKNEKVS
ncbi:MAG: DMT family transporter [Ruminococcus sp.]|nr:DMT family transporter [Ruminococcus sp.]